MVAEARGADTRSYLEQTIRVWLGLPADVEVPALPEPLARRFLRLEEQETDRRDEWGRWDYALSESHRSGTLWVAELDEWLAGRRAALEPTTPLEPHWPGRAPFAACLTHDVDVLSPQWTVRQIARHARAGFERDGSLRRFARPAGRVVRSLSNGVARAPSLLETLERSVELEAARGLTASYLFTPPPGSNTSRYDCVYAAQDACAFRGTRRTVADVMRTLAEEGFDVGLHGSYHAGFRPGVLAADRDALEEATALRLTSTRQHLLHWDLRVTPPLQDAAGFSVDSSLGFNRNVGFRAGTSLPFRLPEAPGLLEVPPVLQDVSLLGTWGQGLDVDRARAVVADFVEAAERAGTAVTFVFHPDKLTDPDWLSLYESTLDLLVGRGAWVTSLRGLDEWWRAREQRILRV